MTRVLSLLFLVGAFALAQAAPAQPEMVMTPLGQVHADCIHPMREGDHIIDDDHTPRVVGADGKTRFIPPCHVPRRPNRSRRVKGETADVSTAEGWQAYTQMNNANNATFTYFGSTFNVPAEPGDWPIIDDAIFYLFPGLQNDDWVPEHGPPFAPGSVPPTFDIIQPVLQYGGGSSNGGGRYWGVASWYVTLTGGVMVSDLKKIQSGDTIFGNMTKTGAESWFIGSRIDSTGETTNVQVTKPRLAAQSWAFVTLEVYNLRSCKDFPQSNSPSKFTQIALADANGPVTPVWQSETGQNNLCQAQATSASNGADVTISWQSGDDDAKATSPVQTNIVKK